MAKPGRKPLPPGTPCPKGHTAGRNAKSQCIKCRRIREKKAKAKRWLRAREECDYGYLGARQLKRYPAPRATRTQLKAKWLLNGPYCGLTGVEIPPGVRPSLDHIVSVADGGPSTIENLHWVHPMANWAKNRHSVDEFEAWLLASADALRRKKRFERLCDLMRTAPEPDARKAAAEALLAERLP